MILEELQPAQRIIEDDLLFIYAQVRLEMINNSFPNPTCQDLVPLIAHTPCMG